MALITEANIPIGHPTLNMFKRYPVQESIESTIVENSVPFAQLNTGSNYEFEIKTAANEFFDPKETRLRVKFRVKLTKTDGSAITDNDWKSVSVVNNLIHSLWQHVSVSIGQTYISNSDHTYPFKAMIESLLHVPNEVRNTYKKFAGLTEDDFTKDKADKPQSSRQDLIKNENPASSALSREYGKVVVLQDFLYLDLFEQPLKLPGLLNLKVTLVPNTNEFIFICSDDKILPSIEFQEITLRVTKAKVNGNTTFGINEGGLAKNPALFPISRREIRSVVIDKGATVRHCDNIFIGQVPSKVHVLFTSCEGFGGSYKKNPFNFKHYSIDEIELFVNSDPVNQQPTRIDYTNNEYDDAYYDFLRASCQLNNNPETILSPEKWFNGNTIFAFDLTQDKSFGVFGSGYLNMIRQGYLRLRIHFKEALADTIVALIYCEFDNQISIDEFRNANKDY